MQVGLNLTVTNKQRSAFHKPELSGAGGLMVVWVVSGLKRAAAEADSFLCPPPSRHLGGSASEGGGGTQEVRSASGGHAEL